MSASAQSGKLRRQLVRALEGDGWIRSGPVRDAFLAVPRELFVPEFVEEHGLAAVYRNEVILTKRSSQGVPLSSSSQPAIMATMLEELQLRDGMHVLEVGAGTGYNAALLSALVGRRGRVVSVEVDPEIAREARRGLRAGGYKARVVVGDGRDGFAELAPYDRIIVTASSHRSLAGKGRLAHCARLAAKRLRSCSRSTCENGIVEVGRPNLTLRSLVATTRAALRNSRTAGLGDQTRST